MKKMCSLLLLLFVLLFTSCVETQTVAQECPATHTPQCPFGQPVYSPTPPHAPAVGVVTRDQYSLGYSYWYDSALWACETITRTELHGTAKRKSSFSLDPALSKYMQTKSSQYTNSGYDRAHIVAATNQLWSQPHMDQTFYMTNVTPMRPSFNRGIWRQFEQWVRDWVTAHGDAYTITGAVFLSSPLYELGFEHLHNDSDNAFVPSHFYKILVSKRGTTSWHAIAFLFDHKFEHKAPYDWKDYVISIRKLEVMTQLDFMPSLSTTNWKRMEADEANFDLWRD